MVVFMSEADRIERGLPFGARVALETFSEDGVQRRIEGLTLIDYPMSRGSIAGYYPELNPLLPLEHYDRTSGTPAAKSIPVRVVAC
jgi:formate dehydrogenase major subunit